MDGLWLIHLLTDAWASCHRPRNHRLSVTDTKSMTDRQKTSPPRSYGDMADFQFFNYGGRRHLGFWKYQISNGCDAQECRTAKFCRNRSNRGEIWRFSDFSRWLRSAILDFQKLEISTSFPIRWPNKRHYTKFREDRSNRSRDICDFRFFKMAAVRRLGLVLRVLGPPTKSTWWSL